MRKGRFSQEQIIAILREQEAGMLDNATLKELLTKNF